VSGIHEIVWEFDRETVRATAVCNYDNCEHRYRCDEGCELLFDVSEHRGGYRHPVTDSPTGIWHDMTKADECAFAEWLQIESDIIPELAEGNPTFEIGRTAILPVWQGEDGVLWKRA